MFRKLILSAVLSVGALGGLVMTTSSADARPPIGHRYGRFEVLVRHRDHWDVYRTFRDRDDARRAARYLRQRGLEVKIVRS